MENNEYYKFGYDNLGPLLYGFSHWLQQQLKERDISKVYFFSRDGLIMKKAFEIIDENQTKSFYLEVSRRSLRVPTLSMDFTVEDLLTMISPSNMVSLSSIFDIIGLDINHYTDLLRKIGFNEKDEISRKAFLQNQKILTLIQEIRNDIRKNSKEEYDLLVEYIRQNQIEGKFAIVDIGWSGGMQRFLDKTLDSLKIKHNISGFYTGIADYYKRNIQSKELDLNGYLFDFSHNPKDTDCRSGFVGLYEMLFLETKGSVKRYRRDETGRIIAERFPYEYNVQGTMMPEVNKIITLQQGALDYVKYGKENNITLTSKEARKHLVFAGNSPSLKNIKLFSDFLFYDEGVYTKLAAPKSLLYYIFHWKQLKKDLYLSRWKVGFLKKLFKVPFPYLHLYQFLKTIQK